MTKAEPTWGHRTRTFRALDHRFRLRTTDSIHGRSLERLLDSFPRDDGAAPWYSMVEETVPGGRQWSITFGDELVIAHNHPNLVLQGLLSHINRRAVAATTGPFLVHASVAAWDGQAVVIPGAPDAGKSTLVAALMCAGFHYLSDEIAAIDVDTGWVRAYPKPLSLDEQSLELLPGLRGPAGTDPDLGLFTLRERYLNPRWVDPRSSPERGRLALVVVPHLRPGQPTIARQMARADALAALHANSFAFGRLGADGFRHLVALVGGCSALQLEGGDLRSSVDHIKATLSAHVTC